MKKVICAVAAFAMVAGVATVASAEVDLSGDARFRLRLVDEGTTSGSIDKWDSRIRIKIHAKNEGGGYIKARVRLLDGSWGKGSDGYHYGPGAKGDENVWSDYAYLGFKKGNFDIAGGRMPDSFSPWFMDDRRYVRFRVLFKDGGLSVALHYDNRVADGGFSDDINQYGVTYSQKFSDAMAVNARLIVLDDNIADESSLLGSANVAMSFGANDIVVEQSYAEVDDITGMGDDGFGGYAQWSGSFGTITPTVVVGYTQDGFLADPTFGWLMIGGDVPTTRIGRVGAGGDTIFAGLSSEFQVSDDMSFKANLAYLDVDGDTGYGENPLEVSGQMKYDLGKGVNWLIRAGWLANDADYGDDAYAAYTQVLVKF